MRPPPPPCRGPAAGTWIVAWLLAGLIADSALDAKTFDVDKNGREWFRILHLDDNYVLIGAANALYNVSLEHMTGNVSIVIPTDGRAVHTCATSLQHFFGNRREECVNYIRTALKVEDGKFVLCGSNGGTARCYHYEYDGQSNRWSLSATQQDYNSPPFAPPFPWMNFTITRTSDNMLYTGGSLIDFSRRMSHVVFRNGSTDGRLEPLLSCRVTETTVHALRTYVRGEPVEARIYPNFIASFETAEHVYWLFSEPALELQPFSFMLTSRVARVCKNDMSNDYVNVGDYTWRLSTFSTYWKARLDCSMPGKHSGFPPYAYDQLGYNPFQFNVIGGATPLGNGSIYPRPHGLPPTTIMYGVFNTDRNSIRGSAICAYDHAALAEPFSGPLYLLETLDPHMASPTESRWTWKVFSFDSSPYIRKPHPAQCVNDTREKGQGDVYPRQAMLVDHAKPINNRPLFIQTDHSYQMTHVVVDWQVRALDGRYYDVLFVGTDHGTILKIVNIGGDNDLTYTIIENRTVTDGHAIGEMRMVDRGSHKVMLINTFESVKQVALERCSHHGTCSKCVALRDPYCSWDVNQSGGCVASYDGSQSANIQNIRNGVDSRCHMPAETGVTDHKPATAAAILTTAAGVSRQPPSAEDVAVDDVSSKGAPPSAEQLGKGGLPATVAGASSTHEPGSSKLEAQRAMVEHVVQACPLCIYIVPAVVAAASLGLGFIFGWLSRTYCCRATKPRRRPGDRHDSTTIPLAEQCLLKVNNMDKGGLQLASQSSKVYV